MTCACFFCGEVQEVPTPPALVDCAKCKKPFRVVYSFLTDVTELSKKAKKAEA